MYCPSCGNKLPDDAKFCNECGARLPDAIPAPPAGEEPTVRFTPVSTPRQRKAPPAPARPSPPPRNAKKPPNRALMIAVIAAAVVVVAVVLCILFLGGREPAGDEPPKRGQELLLPGRATPTPEPTPATTPVATPTPAPTQVPRLLDETALDEVLRAVAPDAVAGVYVLDLNTGEGYAAGAAYGQMSASALVNIPVLFTVAERIDDGHLTWEDTVEFRYTLAGRASLDASLDGDYMMVWELVDAMLLYSDNNAANSLIRFLGYDAIESCCHENGFTSVRMEVLIGGTTDTADNYVSCEDVAGMLRMLWEGETGVGGDYLRENMKIQDSTARQGLGAQVPESAMFLNHNGYRMDLYNEAAILSQGDAAYSIVFMAKDQDWTQLASAAGEVNRFVYDAFLG